jgi:hypothetical protein
VTPEQARELRAEAERRYAGDPAFRSRVREIGMVFLEAGGPRSGEGYAEAGAALVLLAQERGWPR